MPLNSARPRHSEGSSYSRNASECRLSPAATTWLRRLLIAPDVGFCFLASAGNSSRAIWAVARTGVPSGLNIVYLALTDFRKHRKPVSGPAPQLNSRILGCGFFFWLIDGSDGFSHPIS